MSVNADPYITALAYARADRMAEPGGIGLTDGYLEVGHADGEFFCEGAFDGDTLIRRVISRDEAAELIVEINGESPDDWDDLSIAKVAADQTTDPSA